MSRFYLIWSREHSAYWSPNSRGYTRNGRDATGGAGVYEESEAKAIAGTFGPDNGNCGPDKGIELVPVDKAIYEPPLVGSFAELKEIERKGFSFEEIRLACPACYEAGHANPPSNPDDVECQYCGELVRNLTATLPGA